jgi:putative peptidoglycan lipid II flippase
MGFWRHGQTMGVAAAITATGVLLSRLMGLVRDKVISYLHGAGQESDIYFASFVIPDFINYLLAGGYFAITLIPLLSTLFERDEEDGQRFFSAVVIWVAGAIVALTLAGMIFAPELARIAAPGFTDAQQAKLAWFLRIVLPAQAFFLTGSCFTALLYLRRQFLIPALVPLVYNGCIILFGVVFSSWGMEGFCWGVLIGAALGNFLLPLVAASRGGGIGFRFTLYHPSMKHFVLLALPLMIGQSVVVLDEQLLRVFGSMAGEGVVSRLNYARRLMLVPVGVVAQAVGVASYPFLARLAANKETEQFDNTLSTALRNTLVVLIPLSVWMMAVAEPTVALIFQQGQFLAADTIGSALYLRIMLAAVFCWGVHQLVSRAFYARKDTLTPSVVGTVMALAAIPFFYFMSQWFGGVGVAGASALAVAAYTAVLTLVWRHKHGGAALAGLRRTLLTSAALSLAAVPFALACVWLSGYLWPDRLYLASFMAILVGGIVFAAVFLLLGMRFAPDLLAPVVDRVKDRFKRRG